MVLRQTTLVDHPTDAYKEWVVRWRNQTRTVPTQLDNKTPKYDDVKNCVIRSDDANATLYSGHAVAAKGNTTIVARCAGLVFKAFQEDGSDIAPLAPFVYDAVLALAYGLHGVLFKSDGSANLENAGAYGTSNYYGSGNLGTYMSHADFRFQGVTGPVHFRQGDSTGYGYGDREDGISFELLNFQPGTYCFKDRSGGPVSMGLWDNVNGFVPNKANTYVFNTDNGEVPADRPTPVVNKMNPAASAILIALAVICILLAFAFGGMIFYKRANRLVRSYQPQMLYVTLLGCLFSAVRIVVATVPFDDQMCKINSFWGHLAFMTVFTTLTIKTWRVHIIVNSSFRRMKISTNMVLMASLGIIFATIVYLIIVLAVGNPHLVYQIQDLGSLKSIHYPKCVDTVPGLNIALYVMEALWLVQGARLCWATKDAPDAVNDSGPIATSMYTIIFCSFIVFLLVFLIQIDPQTSELIIGIGFALATLSAELALFLPKAILLWKGADLNNKMQIIMPDGRTLAEHLNKSDNSAERSGGTGDKPIYDKDATMLLGKNKDQNVLVCKEQILRWQKLMMSIESRQLIGTGSGSSSVTKSRMSIGPEAEGEDALAPDETEALTGGGGASTAYSVAAEA